MEFSNPSKQRAGCSFPYIKMEIKLQIEVVVGGEWDGWS